ncbi:hypothetical protein OROHE_017272 [Orobanche hederae]
MEASLRAQMEAEFQAQQEVYEKEIKRLHGGMLWPKDKKDSNDEEASMNATKFAPS